MKAADVFISYAAEDLGSAEEVCAALESVGLGCWIAPRDLTPGRDYASQIVEAIGRARLLVVLLSAAANDSPHVRREVERAVSLDLPLLPVRIDDVAPSASLEYFLASTHWLDALRDVLTDRLPVVVDAARTLVEPSGPVQPTTGATITPPESPGSAASGQTRVLLPAPLDTPAAQPFVGRTSELGILAASWQDAIAARRQVVAVAGEPGIGKTRLLGQFARQVAGPDVAVLYGRAEEGLGVPFGPFAEALDGYVRATSGVELAAELGPLGGELTRLVPGLEAKAPKLRAAMRAEPETERFRLLQAVVDLLEAAAATRPVLLVLDDLHWATPADVLMLSHLLRSDPRVALMVVIAYRDTEVGPGHPLESVLAELSRVAGTTLVPLVGLGRDSVHEMVTEASGHEPGERTQRLARAVHDRTGGNPFFVGEVLRDLAEQPRGGDGVLGVSEGVRAVVGRRLARLPAGSEELLTTAAMIGARFDLPLLLAACADETAGLEALGAAEAAGLVAPDPIEPGTYRFAHALVQATLQDRQPVARRLALHRQLGMALEGLTGGESRLAELSWHFTQSAPLGETGRAVHYARRSGEESRDALNFEQAALQFRTGRQLLEQDPRTEAVPLIQFLIDEGHALMDAGHEEAARDLFVRAAGEARTAGNVALLVRAALALRGPFRVRVQDPVELGLLQEAAEAAGRDDPATRAHLAAHMSMALPDTDPRFTELAEQAAELGRGVDDPRVRYAIASARVWSSFGPGELHRLQPAAADAVRAAEDADSPEMLADALGMAILAADQQGDRSAAERHLARLEDLADRTGGPWFVSGAAMARAKRWADCGELDRAEALEAEVVGRFADEGSLIAYGTMMMSNRRWRGRHAEVDALVRANAENTDKDGALLAVDQALLASQLALTGHPSEARGLLDRLIGGGGVALPCPGSWATQPFLALSADAAIASADVATAPRIRAELTGWLGVQLQASMGLFFGPADLYVGRLDALLGDADRAVAHLDSAVSLSDATGSAPWAALARAALACLLREREPARAEAERERAAAVADELDLGLVRELLER